MPASLTGRLRFVTRHEVMCGEPTKVRILQQEWRIPRAEQCAPGEYEMYYDYEWRDVPSLPNDPGPYYNANSN
jgi:hypothetical protein